MLQYVSFQHTIHFSLSSNLMFRRTELLEKTCICYINLRYIYKGLVDIAVVVKISSPYSSLGQIYT